MHVALNAWFWDQPHTGSGAYLRGLVSGLRQAAPHLTLTLVMPPHNPTPSDVPTGVQSVPTRGFGGHLGKVWFEQQTYPQAVGRLGADIAHVPYWGPPLRSPAPLVTSVLDVIPLALPDYARGLKARLYTSLVTAAARGSAHTLTLSQAAKADIIQHLGLPAERITPTYLAVSEAYHPKLGAERDAEVRRKYDLPEQFVFYIGGFDVRKNVNQLLLAYTYVGQAEGENIPLVLAGREPDWGYGVFPNLRQYAQDLGISAYVRWLGYVDEADKPALYRAARVFVYPSLYEGFGIPVLEALACGTPVVANNVSSLPEVAGEGAYLVRPDDARQMAGAILALLLQDGLRDALITQGLSCVTHLSWRKTAKETLAVYESVMV